MKKPNKKLVVNDPELVGNENQRGESRQIIIYENYAAGEVLSAEKGEQDIKY